MEEYRKTVEYLRRTAETFEKSGYGVDGITKCFKESADTIEQLAEELKQFKDKQEQGLLIEIPLKVGDTFWELNNALTEPFAYPRIAHSLSHVVYCMERLGKWCFITEAEAEEALAKMGGKP